MDKGVRHLDNGIACAKMLSPHACKKIIQLSEDHSPEWQRDRPEYRQRTVDVEVYKVEKLKEYLRTIQLMDAVQVSGS